MSKQHGMKRIKATLAGRVRSQISSNSIIPLKLPLKNQCITKVSYYRQHRRGLNSNQGVVQNEGPLSLISSVSYYLRGWGCIKIASYSFLENLAQLLLNEEIL